jgi:hypothetical protein
MVKTNENNDAQRFADGLRRGSAQGRKPFFRLQGHHSGRLTAQSVLGHLALREADVEAWRPKERKGRRKGTPMSDDAKARISASQKERWKRRKRSEEERNESDR